MKRILFVDDEPRILMALQRALRGLRREWDMVFAEGGPAALEQCAAAPFDVVVSDARMPGMEGSILLDKVVELYPDTVRIILSGQCNRTSVLNCVTVAHQFLSKPCEPETLKTVLRRICKMRDAFQGCSTRSVVSRVRQFQSQPRACRELADAMASPNTSIDTLADIIDRDVAMTAKVVQLVSSGFFGSPQRVETPAQAVRLLGPETVRSLFASLTAANSERDGDVELNLALLTDHSRAVADLARQVAETWTNDSELLGDAYMAGALHEIGALALAGHACGCPPPPTGTGDGPDALGGNTRLHPDQTGPDPGGYLAALWGLPEPTVQAIAYHRVPDRCPEPVLLPLAAVHMAHTLLEPRGEISGDNATHQAMVFLQRAAGAAPGNSGHGMCQSLQLEGALP